jgi:peptidoglycan/xylan/chitin deacetylase (PgdA/CDA1 family)
MKAFQMMQWYNHRGILFVSTSLIGQDRYLTWPQINLISQHHEIGNHSHNHVNLQTLSPEQLQEEIITANSLIQKHTGKRPRFFVPPFNKYNNHIDNVAEKFGLQIIKNRVDILNTTT